MPKALDIPGLRDTVRNARRQRMACVVSPNILERLIDAAEKVVPTPHPTDALRSLAEDVASQTCEHLGSSPDNGCLSCRARYLLGADKQAQSFRGALNEPTALRKLIPPRGLGDTSKRTVKCPDCGHEREATYRVNRDYDALPQCGLCPECGCRRIGMKDGSSTNA